MLKIFIKLKVDIKDSYTLNSVCIFLFFSFRHFYTIGFYKNSVYFEDIMLKFVRKLETDIKDLNLQRTNFVI